MSDFPTGQPLPGLDATLGIVYDELSGDTVKGHLDVTDGHKQPAGIVHGGVYASIGESAASYGTFSAIAKDGMMPLGISNATSFLRPVSAGRIGISATPIHSGRTTWVWDIEMTDDDGRICAVSRVTIAVREMRTA